MLNNDKITGEIKLLEFGKLKLSTSDLGTIYIEWDKIKTIYGNKNFEITYANNMKRYAGFGISDIPGTVLLTTEMGQNLVKLEDIVEVVPIKNTFWSRIDGKIEAGVNYTKANENFQFNTDFYADYRGTNFMTGIRNSNQYTDQPNQNLTQRSDLNVYLTRFLTQNWYLDANATAERNTELGLDYRVLSGFGLGHDMLRAVRSRLSVGAGVYWNWEKGLDTSFVSSTAEAAFTVMLKKLKYDSPKLDFYTQATVFPSLSEQGRVRFQYDLNTDFEIISDLYVGMKVYFTYDSQPRSENASDRDYGIRSVIGYKF